MTGASASDAVIGIDLGGTDLRAALVGPDGAVRAHVRTRTDARGGPGSVIDQMAALVADLGPAAGHARRIGVGSPGPLDAEAGIVTGPPTLHGWRDVPVRSLLEDRLKRPVMLDNDGHAAALGEWRFGAARGCRHFVYVTVSTGIGGGVVADGRILRGRGGLAGHVGHMIVSESDIRCSCGNRGCWEALASGTAVDKAVRAAALEDPEGAIARAASDGPVDARALGAALAAGDRAAERIVAREADLLGIGFVNLAHLYSPERIVVGGGISALFPAMEARIRAVFEERAMREFRDVAIVRAGLGSDAGVIGAAALAMTDIP